MVSSFRKVCPPLNETTIAALYLWVVSEGVLMGGFMSHVDFKKCQ